MPIHNIHRSEWNHAHSRCVSFLGKRLVEARNALFRGNVGGKDRHRVGGDQILDRPAPASQHLRQIRPAGEEGSAQIDGDGPIPLPDGHFSHCGLTDMGRVVHKHIDGGINLASDFGQTSNRFLIGDIRLHIQCFTAFPSNSPFRVLTLFGSFCQDDVTTPQGKCTRYMKADATSGTGDNDNLSITSKGIKLPVTS
jgi:hypothetical protein